MTLNLYISFSANDDLELTSNIAKIEECLHDLDKWMSLNKLKLNQTKTKLNFFTSTQSIALNGPYPHFVLDLIQSSRLHFSRNIGVVFDSIMSIYVYHLRNISRIRKLLSNKTAETLVYTF